MAFAPKRSTMRLEAVDLLGLGGRQLGEALLVLATGGAVLGVGALVLDQRAGVVVTVAVEVDDAGDGFVEQVEVVADDQQRAPVAAQEVEHPVLGVGVEVVGGLVEQQHVAAGEEDAGAAPRGGARRRTARRGAGRRGRQRGRGRRRGGAPRTRPSSRRRCGSAPRRGLKRSTLRVARVLLDAEPELLDAHQRVVEAAPGQHVGEGGEVVGHAVEPRVLRQVAEAALDGDRAARGAASAPASTLSRLVLPGAVAADDARPCRRARRRTTLRRAAWYRPLRCGRRGRATWLQRDSHGLAEANGLPAPGSGFAYGQQP